MISHTGLQLPGSSPGQLAVRRDKAAKLVGPISPMGGQAKAAAQLRPGPRGRVGVNAVPE